MDISLRSSPLKKTDFEFLKSKTLRLTDFELITSLRLITRYILSLNCEIFVSELIGIVKGKKRD